MQKRVVLYGTCTFSIPLPGSDGHVTGYLHTPITEMAVRRERFPTVVLCPGGAYIGCSLREADPVALRFFARGYQVFTLIYSTGEQAKDFQPLKELSETFRLIREKAADYWVDPERNGRVRVLRRRAPGGLFGHPVER